MRGALINIGSINTVSGGYIYNKNLLEKTSLYGVQLDHYTVFPSTAYDFFIVDSLYLHLGGEIPKKCYHQTIILVHQIPKKWLTAIQQYLSSSNFNKFKFIVTSDATKMELLKSYRIRSQNITSIPPGINKNWKVKSSYRPAIKKLIMVANYVPGKGYENLESLHALLHQLDVSLTCYGNKDLNPTFYRSLEQKLRNLSAPTRINLNAPISQSEVNARLIEADLFISLSTSETFGMAIQEALHTRLPVLMYQTGDWASFETTHLANIVENHNLHSFYQTLESIVIDGFDYSQTFEISQKRSWSDVSLEFCAFCQQNFQAELYSDSNPLQQHTTNH